MSVVWDKIQVVEKIDDAGLREKVKLCFMEAISRGGWDENELCKIPFTLLIPNCPISLLEHTAAVSEIALASAERLTKMYDKFSFDKDVLIAGAVLHDVGKFLEYEKSDTGTIVKGNFGKMLRHPFSGAALAYEMKLPPEVVHIIAVHAHEGDNGFRTAEAILVNKADFVTFDTIRTFLDETR